MRFLKRVLVSVLIFTACYLVYIATLQAFTGYDYTAAYAAGGASGCVELILCALIKREENKQNKKSAKAEDGGVYEDNNISY